MPHRVRSRLIAAVSLLGFAGFAQAQAPSSYGQSAPWVLSAPGTTAAALTETAYHSVQIDFSGTPATCTMRLEGSLNYTGWMDLSGAVSCMPTVSGAGGFQVGGPRAVRYVRAVLVTFTGTGNASITYYGVKAGLGN